MTNSNLALSLIDAPGHPDKVAVTFEGRSLTYEDLDKLSGRIANLFVRHGVKPGDRVAAQVEKSEIILATYLAALRVGAVYLPLNTAYTLSELEYFLNDARPRIFLCDPAQVETCRPVTDALEIVMITLAADGDGTLMDAIAGEDDNFVTVHRDPRDLAAILYTSGTTGHPKGAMLTHGNLLSNAQALMKTWRFSDQDILIHALPIFHTHGLFVACNLSLLSGAPMTFLKGFNAAAIISLLPHSTVLMGVPTFYTRLLQIEGLREAARDMRLFISGSAPLLASTHREWQDVTGHMILERYGMTETNMNTSNPYEGPRKPGSVGFPLPGTEVRIVDQASGEILDQDQIGMIEVRGTNVFKGYWQMPEKTAEAFRDDGFFITGDLGKFDTEGYLNIVGRDKDMIISGGFNVYPIEVEREIDAVEGVLESAVIGVAHPDFGEGVTAVIVCAQGATVEPDLLISHLKTKLAKYKLPKSVEFMETLPRNALGKVQKALLREQFKDIYRGSRA